MPMFLDGRQGERKFNSHAKVAHCTESPLSVFRTQESAVVNLALRVFASLSLRSYSNNEGVIYALDEAWNYTPHTT